MSIVYFLRTCSTPRGFFLFGVTILTLDIPDFSIPDSPQKSSAVQKVYKRPLRRFAPALPEGEPLAGRVTFHWTPEARYGVEGWALLQRAGFPLYNLSVIADAMPPPLVGEALAVPAK